MRVDVSANLREKKMAAISVVPPDMFHRTWTERSNNNALSVIQVMEEIQTPLSYE